MRRSARSRSRMKDLEVEVPSDDTDVAIDTGRWTPEELTVFFDAWKASESWEQIADRLPPHRSARDVETLYRQHKTYLSLPDASATVLISIVADQYESMDEQAAAAAAAVAAAAAAHTPRTPRTPRSGSKTRRDGSEIRVASSSRRSRSRVLFPDSPPTKRARTDSRSAGPADAPDTSAALHAGQIALKHFLTAKGDKARRWALCEFFCSPIDAAFFGSNEFLACLADLGMESVTHLTATEWDYVRMAMGKPRRLSPAFLAGEREKLAARRRSIRDTQAGVTPLNSQEMLPQDVPRPLTVGQRVTAIDPDSRMLRMGQVMTVLVDGANYHIQFEDEHLGMKSVPDIDVMPHGQLLDNMPASGSRQRRRRNSSERNGGTAERSGPPTPAPPRPTVEIPGTPTSARRFPITSPNTLVMSLQGQSIDLQLVANLRRLLQRKEVVVRELCFMNDQAELIAATEGSRYSDAFQQQYAWLVVQLEATNNALVPTLRSLRRRFVVGQASTPMSPHFRAPGNALLSVQQQCCTTATHLVTELQRKLSDLAAQQRAGASGRGATARVADAPDLATDDADASLVREMISACVSLLLHIQAAAEANLTAAEIGRALDAALAACKPRASANLAVYDDIVRCVHTIKQSLTLARAMPTTPAPPDAPAGSAVPAT